MRHRRLRRTLESAAAMAGIAFYFARVFQFPRRTFFTAGLGDWIDPYFINYILEHWHHSIRHLSDPSSPPMFFPVRHTLGYSHGLILFVPFYELSRRQPRQRLPWVPLWV